MENILNEYAAESVTNELIKATRKAIKENTGVLVDYDSIRDPLCDYERLFYVGTDDNGLDLYDMDKIKNKLVDISGDIIKDLMIETPESRELYLYADNNDEIFCHWLRPIIDNYKRKYKKGIYNHSKAIKGLLPAMREAAKLYYKEFCTSDFHFDNETIFSAAVAMEADIYDCYITYEG